MPGLQQCPRPNNALAVRAVAFTETSTPELDAVLERIRQTILIPSYLPLSQRRRLFSPKWKQKLRNDPITMEIDGEELKLTGLDILRDIPNTRSITLAAVRLMQTRTDFNNLARLLEGLHGARRTLKPRDYASITMAAGNKGLHLHYYRLRAQTGSAPASSCSTPSRSTRSSPSSSRRPSTAAGTRRRPSKPCCGPRW